MSDHDEKGIDASAYLVQSHPVLNEKSDARIEVTNVSLENEVFLGLRRDLTLQIPQTLLGLRYFIMAKPRPDE